MEREELCSDSFAWFNMTVTVTLDLETSFKFTVHPLTKGTM